MSRKRDVSLLVQALAGGSDRRILVNCGSVANRLGHNDIVSGEVTILSSAINRWWTRSTSPSGRQRGGSSGPIAVMFLVIKRLKMLMMISRGHTNTAMSGGPRLWNARVGPAARLDRRRFVLRRGGRVMRHGGRRTHPCRSNGMGARFLIWRAG